MKKGFTLLEVLVALAIISLVLVALLRMEVTSIAHAARTSISFRALTVATREMDELERTEFTGELEKEFEPYTIRAKTSIESYNGIPLDKLTLDVLYDERSYSKLHVYYLKAF